MSRASRTTPGGRRCVPAAYMASCSLPASVMTSYQASLTPSLLCPTRYPTVLAFPRFFLGFIFCALSSSIFHFLRSLTLNFTFLQNLFRESIVLFIPTTFWALKRKKHMSLKCFNFLLALEPKNLFTTCHSRLSNFPLSILRLHLNLLPMTSKSSVIPIYSLCSLALHPVLHLPLSRPSILSLHL